LTEVLVQFAPKWKPALFDSRIVLVNHFPAPVLRRKPWSCRIPVPVCRGRTTGRVRTEILARVRLAITRLRKAKTAT
jgi:hypothetical protein